MYGESASRFHFLRSSIFITMMEQFSSLMFGSIRDKVRHGLAIAEQLSATLSTTSYLSYNDWHHLLVSQQVYLTDNEIAYCHKKCTDFHHKEHINLRKFIKGIDLLVPDTHTDPDLFEDVLPQPYRMIAKILEGDILDVAWLEIIRRQVATKPPSPVPFSSLILCSCSYSVLIYFLVILSS